MIKIHKNINADNYLSTRKWTKRQWFMQKFSSEYSRNRFGMISTIFTKFILIRIFGMVAEINSGSIFWLLPLNIVLMSMSMYNIEIVSPNPTNYLCFTCCLWRIYFFHSCPLSYFTIWWIYHFNWFLWRAHCFGPFCIAIMHLRLQSKLVIRQCPLMHHIGFIWTLSCKSSSCWWSFVRSRRWILPDWISFIVRWKHSERYFEMEETDKRKCIIANNIRCVFVNIF